MVTEGVRISEGLLYLGGRKRRKKYRSKGKELERKAWERGYCKDGHITVKQPCSQAFSNIWEAEKKEEIGVAKERSGRGRPGNEATSEVYARILQLNWWRL